MSPPRTVKKGQIVIIIIDTREQKPLKFKAPYVTDTVVKKLDFGDYCCTYDDGTICPFFIERKSISDLFGTLGKGHARFRKEINRATTNGKTLVIAIEKSFNEVWDGYKHSKKKGIEIIRILNTLLFKYKIPHIYCSNRVEMQRRISELFYSFGKMKGLK